MSKEKKQLTKEEKKGRRKKHMKRAAIALAVLVVLQLLVMGWFGGMGLFGGLKDMRMKKHPGNKDRYAFDSIAPLANSPLQGKTIVALGSSVTRGEASLQHGPGEYLAARLGANLVKEAVSGTTLVDSGKNSYVARLQNRLNKDQKVDLFICQLSTNDASRNKPLGEISDSKELDAFDTQTVTGAMEYIIAYVQQTWACPVVFYTNEKYENAAYAAMVARVHELQDKWGIGVLDLYSDEAFNDISDADRKIYMVDRVHPSMAGYRDWWGPELEKQLLAFLQ